jgi:glycosyltransferase involved in cell wall biosynthesis
VTRLLVVSHYFPEHGSGVEIIARELADRLARRGLAIEWAASDVSSISASDRNPARIPMRTWNVTERRLGVPYPLWGPRSLGRLWQAVRRADVVHLHDCLYFGNACAAAFARWRGRPVLVTQHIGLVPYRSRLLQGLMSVANQTIGRWVLASARRCVFYSPAALRYFKQILCFRRPPILIANGVDTQLFRPLDPIPRDELRARLGWPSDRPILLFVGRFVEKKGLQFIRSLAARMPECEWAFVGWGPGDPTKWGLPNVRCLGRRDQRDIAECYQAADLLVLPSVGEGFPLVVQEAMACGTPALTSTETAQGAPEAGDQLITADLTVDALQAKLHEVLPTLAARRVSVANFAREHWDWERCVDAYEEVIHRLVSPAIERPRDGRGQRRSRWRSTGGESGSQSA